MRSFSKIITASVLIASMAFGLASCKGGSTSSGSVTVGITQEPGTFDPFTVVAAGDQEIIFNIYEGLLKYDSKGNLNPCLAKDYEISDSADVYTFTVRDGVKFQNGQELTPNDVVYSLQKAAGLLPDSDGKALVSAFAKVKTVELTKDDPSKVRVTLKEPDSELLSFFTCAIVPAEYDTSSKDPCGTGPFKFDSYSISQNVTLSANKDYWGGAPAIDKVVFKICADMDAGLLELQSGTIDIFPHLTKDRADQLSADAYNILDNSSNMVQIFALNNKVEALSNPKVREAINYAIDRSDIIKVTMDGAGVALYAPMSPAMGKWYDSSLDGKYSKDIDKAKSLLAEAGYPDGFDLKVTVPSSYLVHVNTAVELASELSAVGIKLKIEQIDWATWLDEVYSKRNYESTVICLTSDYAPYDVIQRYASDSKDNFINYSNKEVDELIKKLPLTPGEDEKLTIYHQILNIMAEDNASCYIQDPQEMVAVSTKLEGYNVYPMYIQDMYTVKFKTA
ncbi:MAG: ABC transporter substrate-binding protein [Clostridiales bacterium]|nr:ABC transporter substrate-binding protein [Clostridiales bacterium]